jgi:hypothetical protein
VPGRKLALPTLPIEQDLLYFFRIVKEQPISLVQETRSKQRTPPLASGLSRASKALWDCPLSGGAGRDRTDDPLLAKQVLSQLSYSPV